MTKSLFAKAISRFVAGVILLGVLLFLPAGTLHYRNGWLLMILLFVPMFGAGIFMMFKSPELLKKRLNVREVEAEQRLVIVMSGLMFLAAFILAGFNYRFQWMILPDWIVYFASAVFLCSYIMYAEVLRENQYLSRTIEVQDNQKVVDTGLYGVVRHPMYFVTLLLFLSMPLILGSLPSFFIMLLYLPIIVKRIQNEEKVLENGLEGYSEYKQRVKYRLFPYVW
ncbi:MAG: isoprenylcysteine carboxylmethyltransferase family protein [Acetatifactor sp.]|nr:isoprenylcysteine carboxylmethyltransferase family protein [Acetatifactor sp.]